MRFVEVAMRASVGDRVVIASAQVGQPPREGEVVEVRGEGGGPPWMVRWSGESEETMFFPGPDAHVTSPQGG